jgi:hypothetical protein
VLEFRGSLLSFRRGTRQLGTVAGGLEMRVRASETRREGDCLALPPCIVA